MLGAPESIRLDTERGVVRMFYKAIPTYEWVVRGAVCWPEGEIRGHALIAGQMTAGTRQICVFDEWNFITVDHWSPDGRGIQEVGLCAFLSKLWPLYGCDLMYWHQDETLHRRYLLQCLDNPLITTCPTMVEVPWTDEATGDNLLREVLQQKRLMGVVDGSEVKRQLDEGDRYQDPVKLPALHALKCLIAGYELMPWRDINPQRPELRFITD
jgi:hypothetical protein